MKESLKILVVEDSQDHIEAAKALLKDHHLTVCTSFVDFFWANAEEGYHGKERNYKPEFDLSKSDYDAVLSDLHLPSLCDRDGVVESPTGFMVAFKALENGVKYVGLITDENHHSGPLPKSFDMWLYTSSPMKIGNSHVYLECDKACRDMDRNRVKELGFPDSKSYKLKNWLRLLEIVRS